MGLFIQIANSMRKIFFAIVLFCAGAGLANDKQTAILQHGEQASVYVGINALVEAYDAAEAGDVITLSPGTFNPTEIAKSIRIYGAGFEENATTGTSLTTLNNSIILGHAGDTLRDVHLEGLHISGAISCIADAPVCGLTINKCYMDRDYCDITFASDVENVTLSNLILTKARIYGTTAVHATNLLIENSYIRTVYRFDLTSTVLIDHCIIIESHSVNDPEPRAFTFTNDLFIGLDGYWGARNNYVGNGCILKNCLYRPQEYTYLDYNIIVTKENLYTAALEEIFADAAGGDYTPERTFELQQPETWIGTDGTEIGIRGGKGWSKVPAIPVVKNLQLQVDGNILNVIYEAEVR